MMKVVILLLCVLVVSASAASLGFKAQKKAIKQERGGPPPPCFHISSCLATGTACSGPDPCAACTTTSCTSLFPNTTAACACFNKTNACLLAVTNGVGVCAQAIGTNEAICLGTGQCPSCPTTVPKPILSGPVCNFNSFCPVQPTPTSVTSCTAAATVGAACNFSLADQEQNQCQDINLLVPVANNLECGEDNKCAYPSNNLYAGDSCKTADDCVDGIDCTAGVCVGAALNGDCDVSADCGYGLYCDLASDGTCLAQVAAGKNCTGLDNDGDDDNACSGLSLCGLNGKCIPYFSIAKGGACNVDEGGRDCAIGTFCKFDEETLTGVCATAITTPTICNASTGVTTGEETCNTNYGDDTDCECDNSLGNYVCQGGSSFSAGSCTTADYLAAEACAATNKCILNANIFDSRSCARIHCAANFNCILDCVALQMPQIQERVAIGAGCFATPAAFTCGSSSGGPTGGGGTNTHEGASSGSSLLEVSFVSMALMVVAALR